MKRILSTIMLTLAIAGAAQAQELANFSRGNRPVISPEIQGDSVTFRLKADYATVVILSGALMANPYA